MSELEADAGRIPADACVLVIFGATGDLTKRKLLPALHNLALEGMLPPKFALLGVHRSEHSDESYRDLVRDEVREHLGEHYDAATWQWLEERLHFSSGDLTDGESYQRLGSRLEELDEQHGTEGRRLYYLATPPSLFLEAARQLRRAGLADQGGGHWKRVIVEKPFGTSFESARALNRDMQAELDENQIYRIDHYLGKETVQNILVFRFANGIFEPVWNRRYVDHVQITVAESLGVGHRGGFYEESGALRDMVPNHLFQVLGYVAMEPPASFEANAVRDEKAKIFRAIQPLGPEDVLRDAVRGQYGAGTLPSGEEARAYREEERVAENSTTPTFAAMKLNIDNWRWADVPFYLRTGKYLPQRASEVVIQFRRAPFELFRQTPVGGLEANRLVIRIQPEEGISLHFGAKVPGPDLRLDTVDMDFAYADHFGTAPHSTGYETLLYDAMNGDATLFQRADSVEAAWRVVEPILDVWEALPPRDFPNYAAGTWGPDAADELLERDGRSWSNPS